MAAKKPDQKRLKNFFKLISLDLADKVKAEIAKGLDPNDLYDEYGHEGITPLMKALAGEHEKSIKVLLDAKVDVKKTSTRKTTALHCVQNGKHAKLLLDRGADPNALDHQKQSPLHVACSGGLLDVAKVLLESGAKADGKDEEGKTPYALASKSELRELLKKHGAKGFGDGGGTVLKAKSKKKKPADVDVEEGVLEVDHDGCIWTATSDAILHIEKDTITAYEFEESFSVAGIARGPKGTMYFATNWGLLRFDGKKWTLFSSENSELFDNHVLEIATNPKGDAYMVSYEDEAEEKKVSVFDGNSFTVLSPGKELPKKLTEIQCLLFDPKGRFCICFEQGIAIRDGSKWTVTKKFGKESEPTIYDVAFDKDAMFLATPGSVLEVRKGKTTVHDTEDLVQCLCIDGKKLWIGLSYGGLAVLEDGKITVHKGEDVLPDDNITALVRAGDGTIWAIAGSELVTIKDDVIQPLKAPKKKAPAKKEPKRKLLPFPSKPFIARNKIPKDVASKIEKAKLSFPKEHVYDSIRPAIAFDVEKKKSIGVGASKFGGKPDLPAKLEWPSFEHDEDRPLPFLMQLDLASLKKHDLEGLLPSSGTLYFFSDTSPDDLSDHRVLYSAEKKLERRDFPEDLEDRKDETDFVAQVPEYAVTVKQTFTIPSVEWFRARVELTDDDASTLYDLRSEIAESSRILGWPDSVQDEVTTSEEEIVLLQLDGYNLSPKDVHKVFQHWCGDGLIHVICSRANLAKKKLDDTYAQMAYT